MSAYFSYSDEKLLKLLQISDEAAFTEIYNRYWKLLLSIAANKLPTIHDAEEVVQEVFADLWKRRSELVIDHSIKAFLASAIKYQVWTLMAKLSKTATIPIADHALSDNSVQNKIESKNLFNNLYDHASRLPERCFFIYKLSRIEGMNNKEIASHLDIAEKTIEAQLTQALEHLRAAIHLSIILLIKIF